MKRYSTQFSIRTMAKIMRVSKSGYYAWLNRSESNSQREDKRLLALIKTSFERSRRTYGYRRILDDLTE